ncbi:MAG: hypothetical protein NTY07_05055 [Bacteroidia bacterium]|nr:hypothetical protein [Bacteroidia bacterium]
MIEDLQRQLDQIMNEQNNCGLPKFEGYSPTEMHYILHDPFCDKCPVQLQKLSDSEYKSIPIFNQIKYLADLIAKSGEFKLTSKGFLPTKVVADIYGLGLYNDEYVESGRTKLSKETDSMIINLTRIIAELSGIVKKRNNKLSLTKTGEKTVTNNQELLRQIFRTFGSKFNWAYYDGYGENSIGQLGFGFSLILLSKYGFEKQTDRFYSQKYFNAFPQLLENIQPTKYQTIESQTARCYSTRTFERFLDYFGIIKIDSMKKWDADKYISKTELFDKLINVRPHNRVGGLASN